MKKRQKGFTLIELLVVIAIMGILAAVIVVSLGSSRASGIDAKTKSQFTSIRSAAEVYSGINGNYGTAANCAAGIFINPSSGMSSALNAANYPTGTTFDCGAVPSKYSVAVGLKKGYWCVDSTGVARDKTKTGTVYTVLTGTIAVPNTTNAAHSVPGATACN